MKKRSDIMNLTKKKLPKWLFDPVAPILLLVFTSVVVMYYISGPLLVEFHSDFTDSLLWANVTAETGDILSTEFNYAAILPFGAPFWMVPILKIFGYGRTAFQLSMVVFALIFISGAYYFFRSLKWKRLIAAAATSCLCLLMSGSSVLLEMMWGHTIYYSLSLLFWLLLMGLTLHLLDTTRSWKKGNKIRISTILELVAVMFLCAGCATDGAQMLALGVLPVLGALVACAFFDNSPLVSMSNLRKCALGGLMLLASGIGIVILYLITKGGTISSAYASSHLAWDSHTKWINNLLHIFPSTAQLYNADTAAGQRLFTFDSLVRGLKILMLMVVFAAPVVMLLRYRKLNDSTKLALWGHFVVTGVVGFMYVFGILNNGNWRVIPCLGTGIIVTILWIHDLFAGSSVEKRLAAVLAALLAVVSLLNVAAIGKSPRQIQKNPHWNVTQVLQEKGYDYGYATFWNSHPIALLSDNKIQITSVEQEGTELNPLYYQNYDQDFVPREDRDTCFLLLEQAELENLQKGEYWQRLKSCRQLVDSFECGRFIVLVFDGNIIV